MASVHHIHLQNEALHCHSHGVLLNTECPLTANIAHVGRKAASQKQEQVASLLPNRSSVKWRSQ